MVPGLVVQTGLYRDTPPAVRRILRIVSMFFGRSVAQGADTAIWLASSPEVANVNGQFFDRRRQLPCKFRNVDAEEKLLRTCEELVAALKST